MAILDILIRNGMVADGTGKPAIKADVGIEGDKIAFVDRDARAEPKRTIDAAGCVVAPGFIDVHAHSDYLLLMDNYADNKVTQGITTDIGGNCGLSAGPFDRIWYVDWWIDSTRNFFSVPWDEGVKLVKDHGVDLNWKALGGFLDRLEETRMAVNYASLVGHYVLRATAMNEPNTQPTRRPSALELQQMKRSLEEAMDQGALGFSCAFHHTDPELDVDQTEFVELCSVVARRGGLFTIHLRSYGDRLLSAVREAISITERTGVKTSISHLMADGKENWGKTRPALDMIAEARSRGLPIYTDVLLTLQARNYMSGDLKTLLPDSVAAEAQGKWRAYFGDSSKPRLAADQMRSGISNRWYKARFYPPAYWPLWDEMLRVVKCAESKEYEGLMLADVARQLGCDSFEAIGRLLAVNDGEAYTVLERSSETDIIDVLKHPLSMIGSDGNPLRPLKSPRAPNPRIYGTFPRLLGHFVRDVGALPLEYAILKATSLPAQFLGLADRGELRPGFKADIVVFDPRTVRDCQNLIGYPDKYSEGIKHVLVNGRVVIADGNQTQELPGQVLRRGM